MGCICSTKSSNNLDLYTGKDINPISELLNKESEDEVQEENKNDYNNNKENNKDYENLNQAQDNKELPIENHIEYINIKENSNSNIKIIELNNKKNSDTSNINNTSKSKPKKNKKFDKFDTEIIEIINNFRESPSDFIGKLHEMTDYIKEMSNNKLVYYKKGQPKIVMNTGKEAVYNTITYIQTLSPMTRLEVNKEISIPLPCNPDDWIGKYSILVDEKTKELKAKANYSLLSFHFDLSITDPETSFLLQLVDDNSFKGLRRSHICDPQMKFISVTYSSYSHSNQANEDEKNDNSDINLGSKKSNGKFCSYYTFAK